MAIELSNDAKQQAIASIRRYVEENLDQDIGDLKADLLLEFFLKEIGPTVHNAAIEQAQTYLRDRLVDLEAVADEVEFGYWPKGPKGVKRGRA